MSSRMMRACNGDSVACPCWSSPYHSCHDLSCGNRLGACRSDLQATVFLMATQTLVQNEFWIILRVTDILLISVRLMLYSRCLSSRLCGTWCWNSHKHLLSGHLTSPVVPSDDRRHSLCFLSPGVPCPNRKVYIHYNLTSNLKIVFGTRFYFDLNNFLMSRVLWEAHTIRGERRSRMILSVLIWWKCFCLSSLSIMATPSQSTRRVGSESSLLLR